MAYNLTERFPPDPKYYRFYDPGSYQSEECDKIKPSKFPFLSSKPRITQPGGKIWTHAIYDADLPRKITPNCTSMMSKIPRFPYEAFSQEDLEEILCRCGIQVCECPVEEEGQQEEVICQGKVPRGIFKGPPKRTGGDSSLSAPSKGDRGFQVLPDGRKIRLKDVVTDESPPFYDARVNESTAFYHGWKWSKWSGGREVKSLEQRPGPTDYTIEHPPTDIAICAEKLRAHKRKTSKQYRFIEMVQRQNILEGRPGPATYYPQSPRGTELQYLGPKAERFPKSKYDVHPGPADHFCRRDFDPPQPPEQPCHATLPERACFGMKDTRFKPRKDVGPSPASYNPKYEPCKFLKCPTAPFGSSAVRFKSDPVEDSDDDEINASDETKKDTDDMKRCPSPTWGFKSRTVRMKPLVKQWHEPSPADFAQPCSKKERPLQLQYLSPFLSSEGRFQPWFNYLPVHGKYVTPGPCYYNAEKPRCLPAVNHDSLSRSPRFPATSFLTPAPNEYKVGRGLETILLTHNRRLQENINKKIKFHFKPVAEKKKLTYEEQETILLNKCITICDVPEEPATGEQLPSQVEKTDTAPIKENEEPKLLRCFLYRHQIPICS